MMRVGGSYYEINGKYYPFDDETGEILVEGKKVKVEDFMKDLNKQKRQSKEEDIKDVNKENSSISKG